MSYCTKKEFVEYRLSEYIYSGQTITEEVKNISNFNSTS